MLLQKCNPLCNVQTRVRGKAKVTPAMKLERCSRPTSFVNSANALLNDGKENVRLVLR
jgi:hypothetical protein